LQAVVEVVVETMASLRLAFHALSLDPESGAQQVGTHALLLSKSVAHLAKQMAHLPEEKAPQAPPVAAIKLSEALEVLAVLQAAGNPRCRSCGGLT